MKQFHNGWLPEESMIHLTQAEIQFLSREAPKYPSEKPPPGAYSTLILLPSGNYHFQYLVFTETGKQYEEMLKNEIGGFGPIHVGMEFTESYQSTGKPFWIVSFCGESILAWRNALLEPSAFELCPYTN